MVLHVHGWGFACLHGPVPGRPWTGAGPIALGFASNIVLKISILLLVLITVLDHSCTGGQRKRAPSDSPRFLHHVANCFEIFSLLMLNSVCS